MEGGVGRLLGQEVREDRSKTYSEQEDTVPTYAWTLTDMFTCKRPVQGQAGAHSNKEQGSRASTSSWAAVDNWWPGDGQSISFRGTVPAW